MEVIAQAPQPTVICYHSMIEGKVAEGASKKAHQEFTPKSDYFSGKNLQSYNFEKSLENFSGSFSFTIKEDIAGNSTPFMDKVQPLDIITISESGSEQKIDFIGVVTTISIGGTAANLNKVVTVSGKSIEWLFEFYNINADVKLVVMENKSANTIFKLDLAKNDGKEGLSIKDIVMGTYKMFENQVANTNAKEVSNFMIGEIIKEWFGTPDNFIDAETIDFKYPISTDLFTGGKVNMIDFLKRLLQTPIYEMYGYINEHNRPVLKFRQVPFDNPESDFSINPSLLTDFTLTRNCEEVYTAFMPYIEGTSMSPDFYMNLQAAKGMASGYNAALPNAEKVKVYGYQLLTCSFVGYNENPSNASEQGFNESDLRDLSAKLEKWFSRLDEMYSGDFTIVNTPLQTKKQARIGDWVRFMKGLFYIISEKHSWTYGDNPMINYSVTRGGEYNNGEFKRLEKLSAAYREFE